MPMPMIVGCGRSGTTLLRLMLDSHPALAIPPETGFLERATEFANATPTRDEFVSILTHYPPQAPTWADFGIEADRFRAALDRMEPFDIAEGYRTFYRLYATQHDKPRYGDKTPMYCRYMLAIAALLPEAHFIHVIRDGRDVALSLRDTWFSPGPDIEARARYWRDWVSIACEEGRHCPHYLEVRFEDLVTDPQNVLRAICAFIELDFDEAMLGYHQRAPQRLAEHRDRYDSDGNLVVSHERRLRNQSKTTEPPDTSRVHAWRFQMDAEELRRFDLIAGDTLRQLGYA